VEFALTLMEHLVGRDKRKDVAVVILVPGVWDTPSRPYCDSVVPRGRKSVSQKRTV